MSRTASIDWWCAPRFDAPSIFGRILDWHKGGSFSIEAPGLRPAGRRYLDRTAVLETELETDGGRLLVNDFLAVEGEAYGAFSPSPFAPQRLVRMVRCTAGTVRLSAHLRARPAYAGTAPHLRPVGPPADRTLGVELTARPGGRPIHIGATHPWAIDGDDLVCRVTLDAGEDLGMAIAYGAGDHAGEGITDPEGRMRGADREPHAVVLDELRRLHDATVAFWQGWSALATYRGPYREMVLRSAITLKLLTYHPSGAIVAAGTTSLPEEIGGERNWDYRLTWLRDATFTLYALQTLGYQAESNAWMRWVTGCCLPADPLVLYRVDGAVPSRERVLEHLEGYRGSRPVRSGNGAAWQRQLDIYGEVLDAAYLHVRAGRELGEEDWATVARFADLAADRWRQRDVSIWEIRGPQRDFTYSKVLCWVALDRARRIAELTGRADRLPEQMDRWARQARAIRDEVMRRGRRGDGAFVQFFGGEAIDASALVFPLMGFVAPGSPSAVATLRAVEEELTNGDLVQRYLVDREVEGVAGDEGYFLICSFWRLDNLLLHGRLDEARAGFEALGATANDLGLFSEEWDAATGDMLGNFPQAFSHIGLISTAHNIERAEHGRMTSGAVRRDAPSD